MLKKIVLITAGGAIASFHAAFHAMYETLMRIAPGKFELVGARNGFTGLLKGEFVPIHKEDICVDRAGSMIGADRKLVDPKKIAEAVRKHNIHAIIVMGGDNHLGEAARCWKDQQVNVVGYPKTMDGDLNSIITLGYETAVTVGSLAVRHHHSTAITYDRVFFVGLFGRDTDWVLTAVTAYGGGDFGIPCEQEYEWDYVLEKIKAACSENEKRFGEAFAVIPYSEGARIKGVSLPPVEYRSVDGFGQTKLQPEWLGMELQRLCKQANLSAAHQSHTYDMRDYPPTETDKRLSAMAGARCMEMVLEGRFGNAVVFRPSADSYEVGESPLEEVAQKRAVLHTGYFDYETLQPTPAFIRDYGNLFRASLGEPPQKEDLVFPVMRKPRQSSGPTT